MISYMRNPGGQANSAICSSLRESQDKVIEGTVRVDFGPATTYIGFRNPTVTLRRWLLMHNYSTGSYSGTVGWENSKEEAIVSHLDATQLAALRRNADWQAQVWARLLPFFGEEIAGTISAGNRSVLVGSPGWHIAEAVAAVNAQALRLAQQLRAAGCDAGDQPALPVPAVISAPSEDVALVPSEMWRLDKTRSSELEKDGSNFFDIAEQVRGSR